LDTALSFELVGVFAFVFLLALPVWQPNGLTQRI
jgi:hypothetical protein